MEPCPTSAWCVYMVRCADNTLYTGVTTNLLRRLAEHNGEAAGGARYTRNRRPVSLVFSEVAANRSEACRKEHAIKGLTRKNKELLCSQEAHSNG